MKHSQVSAFFQAAAKDEELGRQIAEIEKEAAARLVSLARERGFEFSIEDSPRISWREKATCGDELSADELDKVAGGGLGKSSWWPEN